MSYEDKDGAPTDRSDAVIDTDRKLLNDPEGAETKQVDADGEGVNPKAREKSAILDMYDSDLSDEKIIWAKDEDKGKECIPTNKDDESNMRGDDLFNH